MVVTKIVVGRVGDSLSSAATSVSGEAFNSGTYGVPVKLAHTHLDVDGTVVVDNPGNGNFVEDVDYSIDYITGTITAIDGGDMEENTDYTIDYDYNLNNLAFKINQVTTGATTVHYVCTTRAGRNGVAVIIYT